jgi:ATP/maltotriose-dependent transcriptional regulator MalT
MVIDRAKRTQPMGYLVKPLKDQNLFTAINIGIHKYHQLIHPIRFDMDRLNKKLDTPLSSREFEITCDLYDGVTNQQLANKYFISMNTVKTHIRHIFDKLGVQSRTEALVLLRSILNR